MTLWSQDRYITAYRFAAEAHTGQLLPDSTLPYLVHVSLVSVEVLSAVVAGDVHDGDLALQCALLHDTLEDTDVGIDRLRSVFGDAVAAGVLALTKNPDLPSAQQMEDSLRRIREQPREIWTVKMADRITNLQPPPPSWSADRIERYRKEALLIQERLHEGSPFLARRLLEKIAHYP